MSLTATPASRSESNTHSAPNSPLTKQGEILFVGTATCRENATQDKLYFLSDALARRGISVGLMVPDFPENRAMTMVGSVNRRLYFVPPGATAVEVARKKAVLAHQRWSCIYTAGIGVRMMVGDRRNAAGPKIVHDFDELPSTMNGMPFLRRWYLKGIERMMARRAHGLTVASAELENWIRARRPELKDEVLYLPVAADESSLRIDENLVAKLRHDADGTPTLLYVGTLWKTYDQQLQMLIELAKCARATSWKIRIKILGGGPDADFYRQQIQSAGLGGIICLDGHVDRSLLCTHMRAADVLLFPFPDTAQNRARCPTKAFYYASTGRPLVTNRVGEVARLFGDRAHYFKENNVTDFQDAVRRALDSGPSASAPLPFRELIWEERADRLWSWLNRLHWVSPAAASV